MVTDSDRFNEKVLAIRGTRGGRSVPPSRSQSSIPLPVGRRGGPARRRQGRPAGRRPHTLVLLSPLPDGRGGARPSTRARQRPGGRAGRSHNWPRGRDGGKTNNKKIRMDVARRHVML